MTAICASSVERTFGRGAKAVRALQGVSIEVQRGEIYGLLGRNGAGKTTLVKIFLDVVRPQRGETSILDISSRKTAARKSVGYLPEDHRFPEYRTGASTLAHYGALSGLSGSERRRKIPELLGLVDLGDAGNRKVRGYSKGMKQRLGLAQALIHDPDVIFLDEPTDGVDPVGRASIRTVLEELKGRGKTIFLNSHLLSEVEQICSRVGILDKGALVQEGSIAQLTQSELVYKVRPSQPPTPGLLAKITAMAVSVDTFGDVLEIGLVAEDQIDGIIDLLRAESIGIRGLEFKRNTLEEVFLDALHADGDAS